MRRIILGLLGLGAATTFWFWPQAGISEAPWREAEPVALAASHGPLAGVPLTVMTYNVEGLPWPAASGRSEALEAIGVRLAALRREGRAPHVVVLQEAFTSAAKQIGPQAGYRYIVSGPAAAAAAPDFGVAALPETYRTRGEGFRPWLTSGLEILSDYPIVAHWEAAFPRAICAGIDCLANKGVMLARVAVPGAADPVEIVTTHLNARRATKTPDVHSNGSFDREMATIDRFVSAHSDPRLPLIVTGDFNVDHDAGRLARLTRSGRAWAQTRSGGGAGGVMGTLCGVDAGEPCRAVDTLQVALAPRANDWQFYSSGDRTRLVAENYAIRFGPDGGGRTLSDHQAFLVGYRLSPLRAERLASR